MLRYSVQTKGYEIWDPELQKMVVSRAANFDKSNQESTKFSIPLLQSDVTVPGGVKKVKAEIRNKAAIDYIDESSSRC